MTFYLSQLEYTPDESGAKWSEWMLMSELYKENTSFRFCNSGRVFRGRYRLEVRQVLCSVTGLAIPRVYIGRFEDTFAVPQTLGEYLLGLRTARGLSRAKVAQLAKVSSPSVKLWETDNHIPRLKLLKRVVRAMDGDMTTALRFTMLDRVDQDPSA